MEQDPLFNQAVKVIQRYRKVSASTLQRALAIGYARAARIADQLEEEGYVGPILDGRPRMVLRQKILVNFNKKPLLFLLIIVLSSFWFYWFQWRPTKIKSGCVSEVGKITSESKESWKMEEINWAYNVCLHKKGL